MSGPTQRDAELAAAAAFGREAPAAPVQEARPEPRAADRMQRAVDEAFGRSSTPGGAEGYTVRESAAPTNAPGAAVDEARRSLQAAYQSVWPKSSQAEQYARGAVGAWLESGARRGWSEAQIVEGIEQQRRDVIARGRSITPVVNGVRVVQR